MGDPRNDEGGAQTKSKASPSRCTARGNRSGWGKKKAALVELGKLQEGTKGKKQAKSKKRGG